MTHVGSEEKGECFQSKQQVLHLRCKPLTIEMTCPF